MGPEDPQPGSDFESFRAARDRFFAKVRPEAMEDPPLSLCPDAVPVEWPRRPDQPQATADEDPPGTS